MRVGVDVDGVIGNWEKQVRKLLREKFGIHIGISKTWDWIPEHCTAAQWEWLWAAASHGGVYRCFSEMPVYPNARKALTELREDGNKVSLITSCPAGAARKARVFWLEVNNIPHDDLHFVSASEKSIVECDVYVEDSVDNAWQLSYNRPNSKVFLINRPWNFGLKAPGPRFDGLDAVARKLITGC